MPTDSMMTLRLFFASLLFMAASAAVADCKPTDAERAKWFDKLRQHKREYITKELDLTKEQQAKFFPVYEEMDSKLMRVNDEVRETERKLDKEGQAAVDADYLNASAAMFELKSKEGAIEKQYYGKFKQILTPRQLFRLKKVERKFTRELMKKYNDHQDKKKPASAKSKSAKK